MNLSYLVACGLMVTLLSVRMAAKPLSQAQQKVSTKVTCIPNLRCAPLEAGWSVQRCAAVALLRCLFCASDFISSKQRDEGIFSTPWSQTIRFIQLWLIHKSIISALSFLSAQCTRGKRTVLKGKKRNQALRIKRRNADVNSHLRPWRY